MTFYILTKGYRVPGNQVTHDKLKQIIIIYFDYHFDTLLHLPRWKMSVPCIGCSLPIPKTSSHKCPSCKRFVHVWCGVEDEDSYKIWCKQCKSKADFCIMSVHIWFFLQEALILVKHRKHKFTKVLETASIYSHSLIRI